MKRFFTSKKNIISITNGAWNKMKSINSQKNELYFILSATSGGCNGFNYNLNLIQDKKK